MAALSYECSIGQAFNFQKDEQVLLGHVVSLKIAGEELATDISLADPMDPANTVAVVAAISLVSWDGGYAGPINIACNLSTANQTKVAVLVYDKMISTEVEFQFGVYSFDPIAKKYYPCFHSDGETVMLGFILKEDGALKLSIELENADPTVPSPLNFPMEISIMPQEIAQYFCVAVSDTDKFVKPWGVKVGE